MLETADILARYEETAARTFAGADAAARAASANSKASLAILRLPPPYDASMVLSLAVDLGALPMSSPSPAPTIREYPDSMYVPAPDVAKGVSLFGGAICLLSLAGTISTGFSLIHPIACAFGIVAAATFYAMGTMASKGARVGRNKTGVSSSNS